ncbi:MAG: sodium:solute symporter family protein [Pseudomonadales bacterium]
MNIATVTIVSYLVIVTVIGMMIANRKQDSADWATGGSAMGIWMIAAGIAGTRIGGVGTYGVAGDVMMSGVWNMWYGVNTFLALALVGLFFAIPYRRLRLTTVSQLFIERYGSSRSSVLTSLCVQTEYLIINIIEPYVIGLIIYNVTGIPLVASIFIGAFVIISYTAMSGLRGTALTNIIHCFVVIFGLAAVGFVVAEQMGGFSAVVERADIALKAADVDPASWWSFVGMGWLPVIAMFFSATIHTPAASVYVNYSTAARSESLLIPAFLLAGVIAALMPFLSGIIGIEAVARYGVDTSIRSYASITQVATDAGPILGGVALAAILAALISSGGPILLASATLFVNDWLPGARKFSNNTRLRAYRLTAVIYGLIAASIAAVVNITSILELLLLGFAMVVPPAVAIAFILYWRKTTEQGAFWGIASGYATGLVAWGINELSGGGPDPSYWTTLIPLFVVPVVSWMTQPVEGEDALAAPFYARLSSRA